MKLRERMKKERDQTREQQQHQQQQQNRSFKTETERFNEFSICFVAVLVARKLLETEMKSGREKEKKANDDNEGYLMSVKCHVNICMRHTT